MTKKITKFFLSITDSSLWGFLHLQITKIILKFKFNKKSIKNKNFLEEFYNNWYLYVLRSSYQHGLFQRILKTRGS